MTVSTTEHRPTVAWVDAMAARREALHGSHGVRQYRHALLVRHGLPTRAREQRRQERLGRMVEAVVDVSQTGRSPKGNLRNFAAMANTKLVVVFWAVQREANDAEALQALEAEWSRRIVAERS